jgi:hypothetical protein
MAATRGNRSKKTVARRSPDTRATATRKRALRVTRKRRAKRGPR